MQVVKNNIWDYWEQGFWLVVPTNGFVKKDGSCVMGKGLAKQVKEKFPDFPKELGHKIKILGNQCYYFDKYKIISFPVKRIWWEKAEIDLIIKSCQELYTILRDIDKFDRVVMPKVGCGNGQLFWKNVQPVLERYLDRKVTIVDIV